MSDSIQRLSDNLPALMVRAVDQMEAVLLSDDADADSKIKAFKELKLIAREMTGSVSGTHAMQASAYIDFNPEYLNKIVENVIYALEFAAWPNRDRKLAERIVRGWCKEQADAAGVLIETGRTVEENRELKADDGFRWDWYVEHLPVGWKAEVSE